MQNPLSESTRCLRCVASSGKRCSRWLFRGRRLTSFSDEEEIELGTADNAPWLLAKTLRSLGAKYEKGPNWGPFVVQDGHLVSGQNPASTAPLADAVLAQLA